MEVKWIKLKVGIFDDEKIKLIDTLPERDTILVIWFKLLDLAGKKLDGGLIMFNDTMPYNEEMLSAIFNRNVNSVRLALQTFKQFEMIEILDNEGILIANWEKHQSLDKYEHQKRLSRERSQRYRDKKKQEQLPLTSRDEIRNVTPTEKELEEYNTDKDNTDKENTVNIVEKKVKKYSGIPFMDCVRGILDYLNNKVDGKYRYTTKKTQSLIKARLEEGFELVDFKEAIDNAYTFWDKKGNLSNMKPSTLFNGDFENRVNNSSYGWTNNNKTNNTSNLLRELGEEG